MLSVPHPLQIGNLIHTDMAGGVDAKQAGSCLTSYVLIALLESQLASPTAVSRAVTYIKRSSATLNNVYAMSVAAYALAKAGDPEASALLNRVLLKADTSVEGITKSAAS